jgi:hypothetical protein
MMHIGSGNRGEWEFEYTARLLAVGANNQKKFRLSRVDAWTEAKDKVIQEIKDTGLEINESVAAAMTSYSNNTNAIAPTISINANFQRKLAECHQKIQTHTQAAAEYDGWVQVLNANPDSRLKLTQADWLYFFGKV